MKFYEIFGIKENFSKVAFWSVSFDKLSEVMIDSISLLVKFWMIIKGKNVDFLKSGILYYKMIVFNTFELISIQFIFYCIIADKIEL
jgi:hypothetical protein